MIHMEYEHLKKDLDSYRIELDSYLKDNNPDNITKRAIRRLRNQIRYCEIRCKKYRG